MPNAFNFGVVSLVCLLLCAGAAQAEIYEWRDAQGRINYSDQPPPGVNAKLIRSGTTAASPASAPAADLPAGADNAGKTLAEQELEFRQRRQQAAEEKARQEAERAQAAERARTCSEQRSQLAALKAGQRVSRFNAQGEREFIDDVTRVEEITRRETFLRENCN